MINGHIAEITANLYLIVLHESKIFSSCLDFDGEIFFPYEYLVQWHVLRNHVNLPSFTTANIFSYVCIKMFI